MELITKEATGLSIDELKHYAFTASMVVDADIRARWVNSAFEQMTGYSASEVRGRRAYMLLGPQSDRGVQAYVRMKISSRSKFSCDIKQYTKSRVPYWTHVEAEPLFGPDGEYAGYLILQTDITEERRLHSERRSSSEDQDGDRYRLLFKLNPEPVVLHRNGVILEVNAAFARMLGYDYQDSIAGREFSDFLHPDYVDQFFDRSDQALSGDSELPIKELLMHNRDGENLWVESTCSGITYRGNPAALMALRNVTKRRQMATELQQQQKVHSDLLRQLPDGVLIVESDNIVYANEAAQELLDSGEESPILGTSIGDYVSEETRSELSERMRIADREDLEPEPLEHQAVGLHGGRYWVETICTKSQWEGREAYQLIVRDISDRKRTRDRVDMLGKAIRSVSDCVIISGLDGEITFMNLAGLRTYGYSEEELSGLSLEDLYPEDVYSRLSKNLSESDDSVSFGWEGEHQNLRKNGECFPVSVVSNVIHDRSGREIGVISVARDITERRRHEDLLQEERHRYKAFIQTISEAIYRYELDEPMPYDLPKEKQAAWIRSNARLKEANQTYAENMGIDPSKKIIGATYEEVVLGGDNLGKLVDAFVEDGFVLNDHVYTDDTTHSEERTYSCNAVGLTSEDGRLEGWWGTQRDITRIRNLTKDISESSDRARKRLAHNLHEHAMQHITSCSLMLQTVISRVKKENLDGALDAASMAHEEIQHAVDMTRSVMNDLLPINIEEEGLEGALEEYQSYLVRQHNMTATLDFAESAIVDAPYSDQIEIFSILREAGHNVTKHTDADLIEIFFTENAERICVTLQDNGPGFNPDDLRKAQESAGHKGGLGLGSMRLRAELMNATITYTNYEKENQSGAQVTLCYPTTRINPDSNTQHEEADPAS